MTSKHRALLPAATILSVVLAALALWCIGQMMREVDFRLYLRMAYLLSALLLVSGVGLALALCSAGRPWTLWGYYQLLWHGLLFISLSLLLVVQLVPAARSWAMSLLKAHFP